MSTFAQKSSCRPCRVTDSAAANPKPTAAAAAAADIPYTKGSGDTAASNDSNSTAAASTTSLTPSLSATDPSDGSTGSNVADTTSSNTGDADLGGVAKCVEAAATSTQTAAELATTPAIRRHAASAASPDSTLCRLQHVTSTMYSFLRWASGGLASRFGRRCRNESRQGRYHPKQVAVNSCIGAHIAPSLCASLRASHLHPGQACRDGRVNSTTLVVAAPKTTPPAIGHLSSPLCLEFRIMKCVAAKALPSLQMM